MSQPPVPLISDDDDDTSHVSTPILTHLPASPALSSPLLPPGSTSSESTKPTFMLPGSALLRLPIPTPSANLSQTSFTFVDVSEDGSGVDFNDLPPEVTSADISIAREFLCSTSVSRLCLLDAYVPICRAAYLGA
jgi:GDP/GTP exchange factor required for growth at low temperature